MKVFKIQVRFPSHCGNPPAEQSYHFAAENWDEAAALCRKTYEHGEIRQMYDFGVIYLPTEYELRKEL